MTESLITVVFDVHSGLYLPGDTIAGEYFVAVADPQSVRAIEVSVLWYTMGKGEEDLAVHYFQRETGDDGTPLDLRLRRRFSTVLPKSPLSYDGLIIKIIWCVRVRVFFGKGREIVADQPFQLGATPRPVEVPA